MILTIALNPSVEKYIYLNELAVGEENPIEDYLVSLGESAIYSAYMIKLLQGEPYLLGFAGGIGGRYIKYFADKNRIKSDFLWKDQETRTLTKIIGDDGKETILSNDKFTYEAIDVKNFKLKFNSHLKDMYGVIINNFPSDNPYVKEILEACFTLSKQNQMKTILSLSGDELRHALHYRPYALILTESDLRDLNILYSDEKEQLEALHTMLLNDKIQMLYYQGDKELIAITKNKFAKVSFQKTLTNDKRMKDLLTGVLGVCVSRKYEMEKTLRLMGAVVKVTDFSLFPAVCTRKGVAEELNKVSLIELYNQRNGYLI